MLKIGITGGIGSGKSTVCRIFQKLGIPVFTADDEAKNIVQTDELVKQELMQRFGADIYFADGTLNRKLFASVIFTDKDALSAANAIIHPATRRCFARWAEEQTTPFVIEEAAILFESGTYKDMDVVITVTAPEEERIERVTHRDGYSREKAVERIRNQWSDERKVALSDFVIDNSDTAAILPQILGILKQKFVAGNI